MCLETSVRLLLASQKSLVWEIEWTIVRCCQGNRCMCAQGHSLTWNHRIKTLKTTGPDGYQFEQV